jgi:homopolymeric O-antigen transport system ATP-binding protein
MASIVCQDISVEFPIYGASSRSLKKTLMRMSTGGAIDRDPGDRFIVKALDGLSFRLSHGDRVGLIGHNGAGKTTLLRVLSGIYEPIRGEIELNGVVSPLLDVALGVDPEATGYENIVLRGIVLGMRREQIRESLADIADFTELGDYLHMPVRTYSAGMMLRLAFAVSTTIKPEILLLDELIGVGDSGFLAKAESRMANLILSSSILVLSTHSMELVRRICNKAILLEHGTIKTMGGVEEVIEAYTAPR